MNVHEALTTLSTIEESLLKAFNIDANFQRKHFRYMPGQNWFVDSEHGTLTYSPLPFVEPFDPKYIYMTKNVIPSFMCWMRLQVLRQFIAQKHIMPRNTWYLKTTCKLLIPPLNLLFAII